jgi:hypothetical protein
MKEQLESIVIHAEALHGGDVLLTFEDGSCAFYSTPLLRSMLASTDRFVDKEFAALLQTSSSPKGQVRPN